MELLVVTVPAAEVDLASGELWAAGVAGIEERDRPDGAVDLMADGDPAALRDAIGDRWPCRIEELDVDVWVEAWKPWATAARVTERIAVRPPWVEPTGAELEVVIDPDRAWGHGAHPTTVLCVGWLARRAPAPRRVLDVGCGSGTVAVAAALLGSERIVAIDVDPEAVLATRANATTNGVAGRVAVSDDGIEEVDGAFDAVVANIGLATLLDLRDDLAARVAPGGHLVLSGVLAEDADLLVECLPGWEATIGERDGWALVALQAPVEL